MAAAAVSSSTGYVSTTLIAGSTKQGAKAWNEDAYSTWVSPNQRVQVAGVYDGHGGYNGLIASQFCRDHMTQVLEANKEACESWTPEEWATRLRALFADFHTLLRDLLVNPKVDSPQAPMSVRQPRMADERGVVRQMNGDPVHGGTTGMHPPLTCCCCCCCCCCCSSPPVDPRIYRLLDYEMFFI